eukprot:tig00000076_g2417.t1
MTMRNESELTEEELFRDADGLAYCPKHRRNVCLECMQEHHAQRKVHTVYFYLEGTPPPALLRVRPGSLIRWRNPRFHTFTDGQTGARIEDGDLPNIEWD